MMYVVHEVWPHEEHEAPLAVCATLGIAQAWAVHRAWRAGYLKTVPGWSESEAGPEWSWRADGTVIYVITGHETVTEPPDAPPAESRAGLPDEPPLIEMPDD